MKKIPSLFVRDFGPESNGRYVTSEVTPGCEWVLAGEGVPTRKFDGTCVLIRRNVLANTNTAFTRREVKPDKNPPPKFVEIETDPVTGKTVGWQPAEDSGFAKYVAEALEDASLDPGTYELIGPRINGNPEGFAGHVLVRHGSVVLTNPDPITFETLREALTGDFRFEGVVWHHPDGRMAKLKRRDFPAVSRD